MSSSRLISTLNIPLGTAAATTHLKPPSLTTSKTDTTQQQPPLSPTYYQYKNHFDPNILNLVTLKIGRLGHQRTNIPTELSSDHIPIVLDLQSIPTLSAPPKPTKITKWTEFENNMNNQMYSPTNQTSIENITTAIEKLTTIFQ